MSGTENNAPARKRSRKLWWSFWILAGVLGGTALYRAEPRIYQAYTNVLIIPQRVPERFVKPTVTAGLGERLDMISQQILSRTHLERIITEFSLYPAERRAMIMEDVIERMRSDIKLDVTLPRDDNTRTGSFSVSFESPDPRTAMRVTERLGSLFVQENLEDRLLLADQINQFLETEVEELRRRLYQSEVGLLAARERRPIFSVLTAEHDALLNTYKQILGYREAAKLSENLERRQIGEQFRIIDGARLPEKPISPRLFPYLVLGALSGLAAGMVFSIAAWAWRRRRPRTATA